MSSNTISLTDGQQTITVPWSAEIPTAGFNVDLSRYFYDNIVIIHSPEYQDIEIPVITVDNTGFIAIPFPTPAEKPTSGITIDLSDQTDSETIRLTDGHQTITVPISAEILKIATHTANQSNLKIIENITITYHNIITPLISR